LNTEAQLLCLLHVGVSFPIFLEEIISYACNRNTETIKVSFEEKERKLYTSDAVFEHMDELCGALQLAR
jgi:hypothetical protein